MQYKFVSVSRERGPAPIKPPPGAWNQVGVDGDGDPIIIAEATDEDEILECWPEAVEITEVEEVT